MKRLQAFSLVEALVAFGLMCLILGMVAQGFSKLSKLQTASRSASEKIELASALQRLSSELAGALTVRLVNSQQIEIERVDPTLNLTFRETRERLPWPWPKPAPSGLLEPNRRPFLVTISYRWDPASHNLVRQSGAEQVLCVSALRQWEVRFGADPHLLELEFWPEQRPRPLKAVAFLPMRTP